MNLLKSDSTTLESTTTRLVISCFLRLISFIDVLFFFTDFLCNAVMKEAVEEKRSSQTKKITAFMSLPLFHQNFVLFIKVTRLVFLSSFPLACFAYLLGYIWQTSIISFVAELIVLKLMSSWWWKYIFFCFWIKSFMHLLTQSHIIIL